MSRRARAPVRTVAPQPVRRADALLLDAIAGYPPGATWGHAGRRHGDDATIAAHLAAHAAAGVEPPDPVPAHARDWKPGPIHGRLARTTALIRAGLVDPARTPGCLHEAVSDGDDPDMVRLLVAHGAMPDAADAAGYDGETALHWTGAHAAPACAAALLALGADPLRLDADGSTPLLVALKGSWSNDAGHMARRAAVVDTLLADPRVACAVLGDARDPRAMGVAIGHDPIRLLRDGRPYAEACAIGATPHGSATIWLATDCEGPRPEPATAVPATWWTAILPTMIEHHPDAALRVLAATGAVA